MMTLSWIEHVKQTRTKNSCTYKEAPQRFSRFFRAGFFLRFPGWAVPKV